MALLGTRYGTPQGYQLATRALQRGRGERVAVAWVAGLVAGREPMLPLFRSPVGKGLRLDAALRLLLDAVVADRRRRVESLRDVVRSQPLDEAGLLCMLRPYAREAIRLQLETH